MTVTVSGNTYNYRDILRNMGGTFTDEKVWKFPDSIGPAERTYLKKLIGCVVTDDVKAEPAENLINRLRAKESSTVSRTGSTNVHGDDESYLNYFKDKNPIAYFGFSSLHQAIKFVEDMPSEIKSQSRDGRNIGWSSNRREWFGTGSMSEALALAKDGWPKGVNKAAEILEIINGENAVQKTRVHSVAGGRVNIGRMLSGNPAHMKKRSKKPGQKVITLFVENFISSSISVEQSILRAACIAAASDVLESNGYSCEIVGCCTTATSGGSTGFHVVTTLKAAGEALNINDVVFALGHPSYFRRIIFAAVAYDPTLRSMWEYMGKPTAALTETKSNEFYIKQLKHDLRDGVKTAKQMFEAIIPAELPIEVKT